MTASKGSAGFSFCQEKYGSKVALSLRQATRSMVPGPGRSGESTRSWSAVQAAWKAGFTAAESGSSPAGLGVASGAWAR